MTRTIQIMCTPFLLALSSCATITIDDLRPTGGGRTYDLSYSTAYQIALDTLEEMKFSIKKDDPGQGEIRAQTDKYTNGIFICEGNIFGIFFTQVGNSHTRVEIQSLYVRPHADLACKENAQRTISEITQRLRQNSSHQSVQSQPVPMVAIPSQPRPEAPPQTRPEVSPSQVADQLEATAKRTPVRSSFDFRKTNWGMSKEQVKNAEIGHLETHNDDVLVYSGQVAGKDVRIGYIFTEDKLVRSKYIFAEQHTNSNLFINDYMKIKEILTEKYGAPVEDKSVWSNELYRNDPQSWGTAVGAGHLRFVSTWDTSSTSIAHVLMGDNFKISLVTEYTSKELRKLERRSKQDKDLSDF